MIFQKFWQFKKWLFYDVARFYSNFLLRPLHTTLEGMEERFDEFFYLKVVLENLIVGSAQAKMKGETCHIENVIVHPDHQSKGIGKKIISSLEFQFKEAKEFELFTGKDATKNVQFYRTLGFEIDHEIPASDSEPILVIMKRENLNKSVKK